MHKPLYLHPIDVTSLGIRSIEILSPFAVVSVADQNPLGVVTSSHPFAIAAGGVQGLPYLPALAPAGAIVRAPYSLTTLLVVTDSNLRPDFRDGTPVAQVVSIDPFNDQGSPDTLFGGVSLSDSTYYPLAHAKPITQPIVVGDTLAQVLIKGFYLN